MSILDHLLFEQAISEGDMDALILLVKKSTTESQGKQLRNLVESKLKQLQEKTGLTGNTFQEVVADYKQRYLFDLYLNNLPLLIKVLESKEGSWLPQLLFQKLSSFGNKLPCSQICHTNDRAKVAYLVCLSNKPTLELELFLSRLLNFHLETKFVHLCLENKHDSFVRSFYLGRLEQAGLQERQGLGFFLSIFHREQTEEVYKEAAEVYFAYWRRHIFHEKYTSDHREDLLHFRNQSKVRSRLHLLRTFLDRFEELIVENSCHPNSYEEITRSLARAFHP